MLRRALLLVFAAVLVCGVGAPVIASAHSPGSATIARELPAPSPADPVAQLVRARAGLGPAHAVLIVIASIPLVGALISRHRRTRRVALVGLSLVLLVGGWESSVHSVHHLGDSQAADRCIVATSTDHVSAADVDVALPDGIVTSSVGAVVPALPAIVCAVAPAPTSGRAPPA